ncbi:MAG: hypothetical protein ACP5DC_10245 [Halothiobacillaceae bacterium]
MRPSEWTRILVKYREPILSRSIFELTVTLVPFLAIWALAWWALSISPWLAMALALANASFLVRVFMIQRDCGHGAFFKNRRLGDWIGRALTATADHPRPASLDAGHLLSDPSRRIFRAFCLMAILSFHFVSDARDCFASAIAQNSPSRNGRSQFWNWAGSGL